MKRPKLFENPIPNTTMFVYDVECYPNYTLLKFVDEHGTWTDFEFREDDPVMTQQAKILDVRRFIQRSEKDKVFVGFYNTGVNGYDDYILKYFMFVSAPLINCQSIYDHSTWIIEMDQNNRPNEFWGYWRMENPWGRSIDVYNMPPQKWRTPIGQAGGLKERAARLGWDRLQDLPYPPGSILTPDQMDEVNEYCKNDVLMTVDQYKLALPQVKVRLRLEEMYKDVKVLEQRNGYRGKPDRITEHVGIDVLEKHDAGICETIFTHLYSNRTQVPINHVKKLRPSLGVIKVGHLLKHSKFVKSDHPEIVNLVERWSKIEGSHENVKEALQYDFTLGDLPIRVAAGGLHSMDGPGEFVSTKDKRLIDIDVNSYYPSVMIKNKLCPQQLTDDFVDIEHELTDFRLKNKESGDKAAADGLKIVVNTAYGKSASQYSFMFDPEMQIIVILLCQLNLLALIARLQREGIEVLSANTDGVLCYVEKSQVVLFREIYHQWEERSGYTLEETHYDRYVRRDVNNYIAIDSDPEEKPKVKGVFKEVKGRAPIIANALYNYYRDGKTPESTINECQNVKEFLYYFHANRGWKLQTTVGDVVEQQQGTCRWFQVPVGLNLQKWKPDDDPEKPIRVISVSDADNIYLMNDITSYSVPDALNRKWYIDKVWSIIHDTEENQEDEG
jgi:hypothetical protein